MSFLYLPPKRGRPQKVTPRLFLESIIGDDVLTCLLLGILVQGGRSVIVVFMFIDKYSV